MKKLLLISLAVVIALSLGIGVASAEDNIPSSKSAFVTNDVTGMSAAALNTESILTTQIKTGAPKDLVFDLSAETSLITDVELRGDVGTSAQAGIEMAVLVDGVMADPGWVTFNNRILEIDGDLTHHITYVYPCDTNGDGIIEDGEVCESATGFEDGSYIQIDDHWIQIFLETKSANAFNYVVQNVGSGVHTVEVIAKITQENSTGNTKKDQTPYAYAALGNVSMVVDEANLK